MVSRSGVNVGLLSLNQEKAFDHVEHSILWRTMERFGFSTGLIARIEVLYSDSKSVLGCALSGMFYDQLACLELPPGLLFQIQAKLVNFLWDDYHWVPQSLLFLSIDQGAWYLIYLASRTAIFRLQFVQRYLTGPSG